MVQDNQLKKVISHYVKHGLISASQSYGISTETVNRYLREYRVRFGDDPISDVEEFQSPNILVFDIETMPLLGYIWGIWDQNVGLNQIESEWFMATYSAKWLNEDEVFSDRLTHDEMMAQNDKRLVEGLWKFLEAADVVVAHNGDRFDIKRSNTRFLKHGINPPLPYQSIDTLKVAKRNFNVTSNKLDYLGEFLGVGRKIDTGGFELWRRCMQGDSEALKEMEKYNVQDVVLLEKVYHKLKPYIKSHPNWGLFIDGNDSVCPTCGSKDLEWSGSYTTSVGKYSTCRCKNCGSIARSRDTQLSKNKRKNLIVSIAR